MPVDSLGARRGGEGSLVRVVALVLWQEVLHDVNGALAAEAGLGSLVVQVLLALWDLLSLDPEGKVVGLAGPELVQQLVLLSVLVHHANDREVAGHVGHGDQVDLERVDHSVDGVLAGRVPVELQGLKGLWAVLGLDDRGEVGDVEHGVQAVATFAHRDGGGQPKSVKGNRERDR